MQVSPLRQALICVVLAAAITAACNETGTIRVHSLTFSGVKGVDEGALRSALATKASSKLPWGTKRYFDRSQFDSDLKRITAFYSDHGYPHARVSHFDVKLNAAQDAVDLSVTIDEGDPIVVRSVNYKGFDVIPDARLHEIEKKATVSIGAPRDRTKVIATQEMALNELRDRGYPYATVRVDERDNGTNGLDAALTFVAAPGKLAYFGPTDVEGNERVSDRVILREVPYRQGQLYRRSLLQQAQRRLYGLSLFQFATVEPVDIDAHPELVPTRVTVAEGPTQRVNLAFGYGTEEQARIDAEYHKLNFLGGARDASARARWSSLDRGVQLGFTQPYLFDPHTSLNVQGQQWYAYTPAYDSRTTGVTSTATYRLRQRTTASIAWTTERDTSSIAPDVLSDFKLRNDLIALGLDPRTNEQSGVLNSIKLQAHHVTAENLLNPQHGYQVNVSIETAGRFLPGTFHFTQITADARHYLPFGPRFVWANRAQLGNIAAPASDPTAVPFSRRFFLGGSASVRGWGIYELSPLSSSGLPIGGNSMFEFSSEGRAVIHGNFGAVAFLDGGNVWNDSWSISFGDLRYAVGAGLRYTTPVGPLRFDFGYQVNPIPGLLVNGEPQTRRWRVHFSIGQAF
ncbi:MAG TPA: outer membrane protein assembly factor BamA [Vicinamibacterales bacterium]|nr:outer membrane protein assembly factor BamA [Vicinamibacterales bacterium]